MQGSKGTSQRTDEHRHTTQKGRVIDMRTWKAKRRAERIRERRWQSGALVWLIACFTAGAAIAALIACIPFSGQIMSILLAWLFALVSAALSSVMFAQSRTYARLFLIVDVVSMAVSFAAALVLYAQLPR